MDKKTARLRRAKPTRAKLKQLGALRLTVHRTPRHIYAQVVEPAGRTIAAASTLDKSLRSEVKHGGNVSAAVAVGKLIAERCKEKGIENVSFDRSGFKYHGRVKALADAAREAGLKF
jgi:large subunit ribosomal protein L18